MIDGQLSLLNTFGPRPEPTATEPARPAEPSPQRRRTPTVKWVGPATCRPCGASVFLYRQGRQLMAWHTDAKQLIAACPACGVAVTTTTLKGTERDEQA